MDKSELKKNTKAWCWWRSESIYYTGRNYTRKGYNTETKDYTPVHLYEFTNGDSLFDLTEAQLAGLREHK